MGRINVDNDIEVEAYLDTVAREFEGVESIGIVTPLWDAWNRIENPRPYTSSDSQKEYFLRDE